MFDRRKRQLIIISIYAILAIIIGTGIFVLFRPGPTCFDGVKNQRETDVDCGGQCGPCEVDIQAQDLQVIETAVVNAGPGQNDVLVKIKNPNNLFGAAELQYTVILQDAQGEEVATEDGTSFILPAETKNIILQNVKAKNDPSIVRVEIRDIEWVEFKSFSEPQLRFVRKEFRNISSGSGYGEVYGLLRNDSTLDFHTLNVKIVLRDENNTVIALHQTQMNTVTSGEERDFFLQFPERFDGFVARIEAEAEADIINAENYMRLYLPGGAFQEYQ